MGLALRFPCARARKELTPSPAAIKGTGLNADQLRMILWKNGSRRETRRGRRKEARRVFGGGVCQRGLRSENTSQTLFRRPRQRKKRCRRSEAPSRQPPCLLPPRAPCLRRRQRRKESERACPWVGGAYLISIRDRPLKRTSVSNHLRLRPARVPTAIQVRKAVFSLINVASTPHPAFESAKRLSRYSCSIPPPAFLPRPSRPPAFVFFASPPLRSLRFPLGNQGSSPHAR